MKGKMQHRALGITTSFTELEILTSQIEGIADQGIDLGYSNFKVQPKFNAIETSSLEVYVKCGININNSKHFVNIDFVSCFLFTCIKAKGKQNCLSWSFSLS